MGAASTRPDVADDSAHIEFPIPSRPRAARTATEPASLVAAPPAPRASRPAPATCASSSPSTMIRSAGSVPDGRTRIRPPPVERPPRLLDRSGKGRICLPLVLVTNGDRPLLLWEIAEFGCQLAQPLAAAGDDAQHLERRDDAIAGIGAVADDHVAALLAAQPRVHDHHSVDDVLVADRRARASDPPAAVTAPFRARRWTARWRRRCPAAGRSATEPIEGDDADQLIAIDHLALLVDGHAAIGVAVERETQIGPGFGRRCWPVPAAPWRRSRG